MFESANSEHDFNHMVRDLLSKIQLRPTKFQICVPYTHDSSQYYVDTELHLNSSGYWKIGDDKENYSTAEEALYHFSSKLQIKRMKMLKDEFNKMIEELNGQKDDGPL